MTFFGVFLKYWLVFIISIGIFGFVFGSYNSSVYLKNNSEYYNKFNKKELIYYIVKAGVIGFFTFVILSHIYPFLYVYLVLLPYLSKKT